MGRLPEKIAAFMEGPVSIVAATRDASMQPAEHSIFGVRVSADRRQVTVLVPERIAERVQENLAGHGPIAITANAMSHETYQIKGRTITVGPAREEDRPLTEVWVNNIAAEMRRRQHPEQWIQGMYSMALWPAIAVTFEVEKLYLQTPGPEAGRELPLDP